MGERQGIRVSYDSFGEVRYFETDRGTGLGAQGRGSLRQNVDKYAERGEDYLSSRLYMNWKTQAKDVYIRGEWFSHVGEEKAPVPTVMFSGARAAATGVRPSGNRRTFAVCRRDTRRLHEKP